MTNELIIARLINDKNNQFQPSTHSHGAQNTCIYMYILLHTLTDTKTQTYSECLPVAAVTPPPSKCDQEWVG